MFRSPPESKQTTLRTEQAVAKLLARIYSKLCGTAYFSAQVRAPPFRVFAMQRFVLLEAASTAEAALGSSLEMLYYSLSSCVGFFFFGGISVLPETAYAYRHSKMTASKGFLLSCCSIQGGGKRSWVPTEQIHPPGLTSFPLVQLPSTSPFPELPIPTDNLSPLRALCHSSSRCPSSLTMAFLPGTASGHMQGELPQLLRSSPVHSVFLFTSAGFYPSRVNNCNTQASSDIPAGIPLLCSHSLLPKAGEAQGISSSTLQPKGQLQFVSSACMQGDIQELRHSWACSRIKQFCLLS